MLNFFRSQPVCPIDDDLRYWVDGRFRWLGEQLGEELPRKIRVIRPTPEFFPDSYHGKKQDVQAMFVRVAEYMGVAHETLDLFFYSGRGSAGQYVPSRPAETPSDRRAKIGIEESQLADPLCLVATLAHEIGHEILIGKALSTPNDQDHEPLTDLLTVFLGMGIFTANSTIRDRAWTVGRSGMWETRKLGYLDQRTFGYALALFASTRGEASPPWMESVRPDVRSPMKAGLRFLAKS